MTRRFDLIALDVDGTLLTDDHVLLPEVRLAVREAAAGGAAIVLCTGRGPLATLPVMQQLDLSGTMIVHNGGATIRSEDLYVVSQYVMEHGELDFYIRHCREQAIQFDLNTAFDILVESLTEEAREMYRHHLVEPMLMDAADPLPAGLLKMSVFGSKGIIDQAQEHWESLGLPLQIIRSGDSFIDIQHQLASKGSALEKLAEERGVPRERIFAVGNYYNDISMLRYAGVGIAMGNSPKAVKEAAAAVVSVNNEGGVAAALRQFAFV